MKFVIATLIMVGTVLLSGFYMMYFWKWFLIPIFPILFELTYIKSVGLGLFFGFWTKSFPVTENELSKSRGIDVLIEMNVTYLLSFFIAYIVHLFY